MLIYNDTENPNDAILGMEPDDLSGRYIAMPTDYLWDPNLGMAHLPPRTAALLCMSLCMILDPTGTENYRQMTTSYDTISTLLCLPPSIKGSNRRRWIERELKKLYECRIRGIRIFASLTTCNGYVMICLNPEAMPYFEGFTQGAGKRYIKIHVDSVYRLKHKYAWDWYRLLLNNSENGGVWTNCKFSTSFLKKWLGLGINAYMRPKEQGGFDATHFRQYCIQAPLEEVAAGEQIKIYPHGEKGKLYYKDKAGLDNGDKVLGYYVDYVVYDNNRTKKLTKKRKSSSEHAESD